MNNAHVTTEAPISTRSGMTGDLADFAIATFRNARVGNLAGLPTVRPQIAFFGEPTPALADYRFYDARTCKRIRDRHHVLEPFGRASP
jgi:hypothetical protein